MRKICIILLIITLLMAMVTGCDETLPPKAGFSAARTSGTAPLEVQFSSESTGEITDWLWDFDGDGIVDSKERHSSYTYESAGTYTVSLKVVGPGGSDTEIIFDYITVTQGTLTEVVWILATSTMPGDPRTDIMYEFAELIYDKSDGRMEIDVFTGGELYEDPDIFNAVSAGAIEMGSCPPSYYFGNMPQTGAAFYNSWSFDIGEVTAARKALAAEFTPAVAEAHDHGIMHFLWTYWDFIEFFFDRPVITMADVAGLNVSTPSTALEVMVNAMGVGAVMVDESEVYPGAQAGFLDGAVLPLGDYINLMIYEQLPYVVITELFPATYSTLMNRSAFEALPADLQDIVMEAAAEAEEEGFEASIMAHQALLDGLEVDPNVDVYYLPASEQQNWWYNAINPVLQGMLTHYLGDELASATAIANNAIAEYQAP